MPVDADDVPAAMDLPPAPADTLPAMPHPAMLHRLRHVPRPEAVAAVASLGVSVGLLAVKFAAYALTSSAAVYSDALEGVVNVLASGFAAYALVLAHQPADADHPYGHGKIEFLSAAFEGGMILLAAVLMLARAARVAATGEAPTALGWGAVLMAAAGAVNGAVGWSLVRLGRRRGAMVLEADGHHLLTDAATSAGVVLALLLVRATGRAWVDPLAAAGLGLFVGFTGLRLLRSAGGRLMDKQDADDEALLGRLLDAHLPAASSSSSSPPAGRSDPPICSYHKLRHRHAGREHWVDFHVRVPASLDVAEGHRVASLLERELQAALPPCHATAHVEPCGDPACPACAAGETERHDPAYRSDHDVRNATPRSDP